MHHGELPWDPTPYDLHFVLLSGLSGSFSFQIANNVINDCFIFGAYHQIIMFQVVNTNPLPHQWCHTMMWVTKCWFASMQVQGVFIQGNCCIYSYFLLLFYLLQCQDDPELQHDLVICLKLWHISIQSCSTDFINHKITIIQTMVWHKKCIWNHFWSQLGQITETYLLPKDDLTVWLFFTYNLNSDWNVFMSNVIISYDTGVVQ